MMAYREDLKDGLEAYVLGKARLARQAAAKLAAQSAEDKDEALRWMADALWDERRAILAANERDVEAALRAGSSPERADRLQLSEGRVEAMVEGLHQVSQLPCPIGDILEQRTLQNGLRLERCRVPIGVLAIIYESRPNVTVDASGLAIKTGNAVVLRGGSEALGSNRAIVAALHAGLRRSPVSEDVVQLVESVERHSVDVLLRARGLVQLAIPRGGAGLIRHVVDTATVPVIETGVGNCHIYVDRDANPDMALSILLNAKTSRPSVCNAAETLLVDAAIAQKWLPMALRGLAAAGVEVRGCEQTLAIAASDEGAGCAAADGPMDAVRQPRICAATESDYETEFLGLTLAVKVVDDVRAALSHIERYGTQHSEAIVTENEKTAEYFLSHVDAAVVYHNASTRFTDGFEFGFGAEIGISTQKLHARGPMGMEQLTSYQYRVRGTGQVRV